MFNCDHLIIFGERLTNVFQTANKRSRAFIVVGLLSFVYQSNCQTANVLRQKSD